MPAQPIPYMTPLHAAVYRSFANWLKSDPNLKRIVAIWQDWDDNRTENAMPASASQLPWVQLTPMMGPMEPFCMLPGGRRSFSAPMTIAIETAVSGSLAENSMKLWEAIRVRGMTWNEQANNCMDHYAIDPAQITNDADFTLASGKFTFELHVDG